MNTPTTTPITIAIPGEKRNGQQVKQFLLEQKLIQKDDMNLEVISASRIGVRFVQMRANNALNFLENNQRSSRTIRPLDGAICGIDQMIESLRYDTIMDEDTLVGFSQDEYEDGRDDPIETGNKIKVYDMPFVLDSESSTKIQAFVRQDQLERFPTIESLGMRKKRWKGIATPYPNLAETLLRPLENIESEDPRMFLIDRVGGKTESLVSIGYYDAGIDVVDTGETIRKNGLVSIGTLFESYPAGIFSQVKLEQDKKLQQVVQILTEASNNAYYNSSRYRQQYPRG